MNRWMENKVLVVLAVATIVVLFSFSPFFKRPTTTKPAEIPKEATSTSAFREEIPEGSSSGEIMIVTRVIDGDTVEIEGGMHVRYIGMDTPESVDPRKTVQCFGREAAEENRKLVDGKTVRLEKDVSKTDRYGRLLRYVYIGDVFINDYLVRQGFAQVSTFPPDVLHQEQFLAAEREAREQGRGLWSKCGNSDQSDQLKAVAK